MTPARKQGAFTLIELLIVVAIIAILAAIAVPNFLEAQVRSKVSRVKADMRTVATAMEAYVVDWNTYVNDSDNTIGKNGADGLKRLTTPVAYITTLARDPFQSHVTPNTGDAASYFELGSGADNLGWGTVYPRQGTFVDKFQTWILISLGTDVDPSDEADDTEGNDEWPGLGNAVLGGPGSVWVTTYDSSNGTISDGDIVRLGGAENVGNYYVNNKKFGSWQ